MTDAGTTEAIWRSSRERLLAFFRRRGADEHAAEDLLQETMLRVHRGLADVRAENGVGPWLFTVARNVLTDARRARAPAEPLEEAGEGSVAAPEPRLDAPNQNREVEGWLRSMVASLAPEYREAVELTELEALPQVELARRLGLSPSGAKSRVQRGRRLLRDKLLECCHIELDRRGNVVDTARRGPACARCDCDEPDPQR